MRETPENHVGIFEAKTHFSELVDRVRAGETFVVTKHGMPVARLVPAEGGGESGAAADSDRGARIRRAAEAIRAVRGRINRAGGPVTPAQIKEWIEEGRR